VCGCVRVGTCNDISSIHWNKKVEDSRVLKKFGDVLVSMLSGVNQCPLTFQYFSLSALNLGVGQA